MIVSLGIPQTLKTINLLDYLLIRQIQTNIDLVLGAHYNGGESLDFFMLEEYVYH